MSIEPLPPARDDSAWWAITWWLAAFLALIFSGLLRAFFAGRLG